MKNKKIMLSVVSGLLVAAVAVGGTLAYLSDTSNTVTNTFNVGSGYIDDGEHQGLWLDEIDIDGIDEEGNPAERTESGNEYGELLPGSVVVKDPTFHMTGGSVESYVIAKVTGVDAAEAAGYIFKNADGEVGFNSEWVKVANTDGTKDSLENTEDGYYIYSSFETNAPVIVDATAVEKGNNLDLTAMFNTVELDGALTDISSIEVQTVKVQGVAVQADNNTPDGALEVAVGLDWNI